jgi:hypothetical protein
MAANPAFFSTPIFGRGLVSAANANMDGTGSLVTLLSAVSSDTKIEMIHVHARQTTTAGMVRIFLFDGSATYTLFDEIPVSANTISASNPAFSADRDYSFQLKFVPTGYSLVASTHNAEAMFVGVWGGKN